MTGEKSEFQSEFQEILADPTLAEVVFAARRLCHRKGIEYDEFTVGIVPYSRTVIVYLIDEGGNDI